jgi:2-phosphoglycerate kinase
MALTSAEQKSLLRKGLVAAGYDPVNAFSLAAEVFKHLRKAGAALYKQREFTTIRGPVKSAKMTPELERKIVADFRMHEGEVTQHELAIKHGVNNARVNEAIKKWQGKPLTLEPE